MKRYMATVVLMGLAGVAAADPASARDAFLKQQAFNEMQRVSGQMDVLQTNLGELAARLGRLESGNRDAELEALKAEIAALKASNAELRRQMGTMRDEIIAQLTKKIAVIVNQNTPAPSPRPDPTPRAAVGPHREYTVAAGDTLSLIATTFNTTIAKIKEMNNLKSDNIRVGQTLMLPL